MTKKSNSNGNQSNPIHAPKMGYDVDLFIKSFGLNTDAAPTLLKQWLAASYELDTVDSAILDMLYAEMEESGDYLNEEELKIKFVGAAFLVAKIQEKNKIRVFYERPLATKVDNFGLAVICDCMVASPFGKNSPHKPYFFLQEFKKGKGEKNDPEGQMLQAMLIAQTINNDGKPIYGGYLVGTDWRFTTLAGKDYCVSKKYDAAQRLELVEVVMALRHLKSLILNR